MNILLASLTALPLLLASPAEARDLDRFRTTPDHGKTVLPHFSGREKPFRRYRTMIGAGMKAGPNFAGHFAVIGIGAGTENMIHFIGDTRTGRLWSFPQEMDPFILTRFTLTSRLLWGEWRDYINDRCMIEAYTWQDHLWHRLASFSVGPAVVCYTTGKGRNRDHSVEAESWE